MKTRVVASVAMLALLAGACGNDEVAAPADTLPDVDQDEPAVTTDAPADEEPVDDTIQGSWTLRGLTIDGERIDMLDDWPVTMTIDGDQIGGTSACNSYGGTVQTDGVGGGRFVTSDLFATEMGCEQVAMEMEQHFLGALQTVDSYELADGLFLAKEGAATSLEFERNAPIPDADLTGTTWVLDTLISGDSASNMAGMEMAYLEFGDDGTVTGSTGCRRLEGEWVASGATLQVPSLTAIDDPTAGVCSPLSESLDGQFIAVVESGMSVAIDGQRLTLLAPGGDGLSFRAGERPAEASGSGGAADLDLAGGVDGPVMYAQQTDSDRSMAAEVRGTLVLEGDCLYITADFGRFPVLWPFGTYWQAEPAGVVLPDGRVIEIGEDFSGGGGYVYPETLQGFTGSEHVAELADRCADGEYREVAVVQSL